MTSLAYPPISWLHLGMPRPLSSQFPTDIRSTRANFLHNSWFKTATLKWYLDLCFFLLSMNRNNSDRLFFFLCDGDIEITALFAMCNNCTYMLLFNKFSYFVLDSANYCVHLLISICSCHFLFIFWNVRCCSFYYIYNFILICGTCICLVGVVLMSQWNEISFICALCMYSWMTIK